MLLAGFQIQCKGDNIMSSGKQLLPECKEAQEVTTIYTPSEVSDLPIELQILHKQCEGGKQLLASSWSALCICPCHRPIVETQIEMDNTCCS